MCSKTIKTKSKGVIFTNIWMPVTSGDEDVGGDGQERQRGCRQFLFLTEVWFIQCHLRDKSLRYTFFSVLFSIFVLQFICSILTLESQKNNNKARKMAESEELNSSKLESSIPFQDHSASLSSPF